MSKIEEAIKLAKILSFLEKYEIENTTINKDLTVDVNGNVSLWAKGLTEIPIQFGRVEGDFRCNDNNLISLKGCPKYVGGIFNCSNNQLTSLKGSPEEIGGSFYCRWNKLTTLEGCPKYVNLGFYCGNNQLTSLEGCPREIEGDFCCNNNQLSSLVGIPKKIGHQLDCTNNSDLKSLKGIGVVHGKIYSDFFVGKLEDYNGEL